MGDNLLIVILLGSVLQNCSLESAVLYDFGVLANAILIVYYISINYSL